VTRRCDALPAHFQTVLEHVCQSSCVRVGTWNLAGRWTDQHHRFLVEQACDVWLITEVNERVGVREMRSHRTEAFMAAQRRWAGAFSTIELHPMEDPHPASAMARIGSLVFVSSILSWRTCGDRPPWDGQGHAEKTRKTVEALASIPVETLGLVVPTTTLAHRIDGLHTIDHIAFPRTTVIQAAQRVGGEHEGKWLSDHDAYVVTVKSDAAPVSEVHTCYGRPPPRG
jgi:hypothetical protein